MKEVSGRTNGLLIHVLEQRGISLDRLLDGVALSEAEFRDSRRRCDWPTYVRLHERLEKLLGGSEELERAGMDMLMADPMRPARALAGYLVSPQQLYWMMSRWVGPSLFGHIRLDYADLGDGRLRMGIEIPEPHEVSPGFFRIAAGFMRRAPVLLGLQDDSRVAMETSGRRAVYTIEPPRSRSLWHLFRRLLRMPVAALRTVDELGEQQEDLNRSYAELSREEAALGAQRGQLEAIDVLGQTLAAQIESEHLGDGLLEALRERFGWSGAALWVGSPTRQELELVSASGGAPGSPEAHPLTAGGRMVGRLDVWGPDGVEDDTREELFGKMLPWIAMAVANARAGRGEGSGPEQFRWSGEGGTELFVIIDADGRVRYAGPTVESILGISQEDVVDRHIGELIHPDDGPDLRATFTSFGAGPGSATFAGARVRHANGTWRVVEGVGIKVQDEHDRPVYMFSGSDVTHRRQTH